MLHVLVDYHLCEPNRAAPHNENVRAVRNAWDHLKSRQKDAFHQAKSYFGKSFETRTCRRIAVGLLPPM